MPKKNILVFSDGTGQTGGKKIDTNVYKLFKMVENRTERQIAYYDEGLGTGWAGNVAGLVSGLGISKNILQCYKFIFDNYNAGDDIFLFGYSRGGTTVRSLAGFIHMFGMLPKSRPELIKKAYRIYKISDPQKRQERAKDFVERYHNMWCRIKFIGVWDTVEALGLPIKSVSYILDKIPFFKHNFHSLDLSESIIHARHALALDDDRKVFHATYWNKDLSKPDQTLKQVWFVGSHADVGGGNKKGELSDLPFIWITHEAIKYGLWIYPRNKIKLSPNPNGFINEVLATFWNRLLYRRKVREWDTELCGKPLIHESVLLRTKSAQNEEDKSYDSWIFKHDYEVEPWPEDERETKRIRE